MIITNILQGIGKKLRKKQSSTNYPRLSWLSEKIIKHQEDQLCKQHSFGKFVVNYKRPYEMIKTYKEIFNDEIYQFKSNRAQPIILDCGANIGLSTIYFGLQYPNSTIHAFEPDASIFELLQKNRQDNHLSNINLHNQAVWTQDTELSFSNKGSEASQIDATGQSATKVKAIHFAHFLQQFEIVDFLKMDIEGAEFEVVQDCAEQLYKIQNFFLEYHGRSSETQKLITLLEIVKQAGFKVYIKMAADNLDKPFVQQSTGTPFDVQLNIFCYQ